MEENIEELLEVHPSEVEIHSEAIHPSSKPRFRYKASKELRDKTKKATKKDYKKLVTLATAAIINKEPRVLITFPYFVKLSKDWPRGTIVERTATTNTYKVNSRWLLDWLYKKGYSTHNTTMILMSAYSLERNINSLDRMGMTEEEYNLIARMDEL
jgi:predicted nucleotide-binding protein (sugar kinase/HSP70/actin superfamily)